MGNYSNGSRPFQIDRIFLDEESESDWMAQALLKNLPSTPVVSVRDKRPLIKEFLQHPDPLGSGKRSLLITRFLGKRLKPCPGTSQHICCGYHVINAFTNCPMDCAYCVLQIYLNNPLLTLYSNLDDLLQEIETFLSTTPGPLVRLGTGELSDSLALDSVIPLSQVLVPFFAKKKNAVLELKTKSAEIDHLLSVDHRGRTIVSWSLNPRRMIEEEEIRTAPLEKRIEAARKVLEKGYLLGFHFDPIIHHEGWEKGYEETIHSLFEKVDPGRIAWISLGGFRYPPSLKITSGERFPNTRIFLGELFPGRDGKFRYLMPIRVGMYRKILGWLRDVDPDLFVYLCMESKEVWDQVFGWSPRNTAHLNQMFEERMHALLKQGG
jgi:spore photoproduct lyase